jgi:TonB family protein
MTRLQRTAFLILAVVAWVAVSPAQPQQKDVAAGPDPYVPARAAGNLEVLSDTKGVDFGPYLSKFLQQIRKNWYNYIPEDARPPQLVSGKTSIEFAILPGGQIAGMKIVHPSGNVRLDRAAWGGITACSPLDQLPREFKGAFLALRFHFYYNPGKLPADEQPHPGPASLPADTQASR